MRRIRINAAGISAGLHTYAFFIAKDCPWVTPVPDRRLASDATFKVRRSGLRAFPISIIGFCTAELFLGYF